MAAFSRKADLLSAILSMASNKPDGNVTEVLTRIPQSYSNAFGIETMIYWV